MKLEIADAPSKVIHILQNAGYEAFIVGGSVRDLLMGNTPQDWDITTSAPPEKVIEIFNKTIPTGLKHGTVTVILENIPMEVTTYRVEKEYEDNRRPKNVDFVSDIKQDLARRDFTVNAMAYNENTGLIDLFGGEEDIHKKLIKCVGIPSERYKEDALRMLRAVRFSAKLGFDIQKDTLNAINLSAGLLKNISKQRVKHEFELGLNSEYVNNMAYIWHTGMESFIHPALVNIEFEDKLKFLKKMPTILPVRLAVLFENYNPEQVNIILHEMDFDNKTINLTVNILKALKISTMIELKRFISKNDFQAAEYANHILKERFGNDYVAVKCFMHIKTSKPPIKMSDLNINGDELKKIGIIDGLKIGKILSMMLEKIWENPILNEKNKLIELVKNIKEEYNEKE